MIERGGAFDDAFVNLIKQLTGDGERDALRAEDYCFSTSSRTTYAAADIGLSMAMADAYMVALLAEHDVHGRPLGGTTDSQTHHTHHTRRTRVHHAVRATSWPRSGTSSWAWPKHRRERACQRRGRTRSTVARVCPRDHWYR